MISLLISVVGEGCNCYLPWGQERLATDIYASHVLQRAKNHLQSWSSHGHHGSISRIRFTMQGKLSCIYPFVCFSKEGDYGWYIDLMQTALLTTCLQRKNNESLHDSLFITEKNEILLKSGKRWTRHMNVICHSVCLTREISLWHKPRSTIDFSKCNDKYILIVNKISEFSTRFQFIPIDGILHCNLNICQTNQMFKIVYIKSFTFVEY